MIDDAGISRFVPGTWRPPSVSILPERLDEARRFLEAKTAPCGEAAVGDALMPLLMTTQIPNTDGMSEQTLQGFYSAKAVEYARLLRDLPIDILKAACDESARSSPFFPTVADLMKFAKPMIEKRQRQLDRVNRLIATTSAPKQAAPFKPEAEVDRLRGNIKRWRENRGHFLSAMLKRTAISSEKRLAEIEDREPEEWAQQASMPMPASPISGAAIVCKADGTAEIVGVDKPESWQAGAPIYQPNFEPPPITTVDEAFDAELEP